MDASSGPALEGIATVEVLEPAELRIGDLRFPEPPPDQELDEARGRHPATGDVLPAVPLPNSQEPSPAPHGVSHRLPAQEAPLGAPPAPVTPSRGRLGYYGRILR